jgi:hypothetical protein
MLESGLKKPTQPSSLTMAGATMPNVLDDRASINMDIYHVNNLLLNKKGSLSLPTLFSSINTARRQLIVLSLSHIASSINYKDI